MAKRNHIDVPISDEFKKLISIPLRPYVPLGTKRNGEGEGDFHSRSFNFHKSLPTSFLPGLSTVF